MVGLAVLKSSGKAHGSFTSISPCIKHVSLTFSIVKMGNKSHKSMLYVKSNSVSGLV